MYVNVELFLFRWSEKWDSYKIAAAFLTLTGYV